MLRWSSSNKLVPLLSMATVQVHGSEDCICCMSAIYFTNAYLLSTEIYNINSNIMHNYLYLIICSLLIMASSGVGGETLNPSPRLWFVCAVARKLRPSLGEIRFAMAALDSSFGQNPVVPSSGRRREHLTSLGRGKIIVIK